MSHNTQLTWHNYKLINDSFDEMLSYRHAFHAGHHADVLKHFIEVQLLRYLAQKDKPFWYIDTHAGAGCYALDSGYAMQNAEYEAASHGCGSATICLLRWQSMSHW